MTSLRMISTSDISSSLDNEVTAWPQLLAKQKIFTELKQSIPLQSGLPMTSLYNLTDTAKGILFIYLPSKYSICTVALGLISFDPTITEWPILKCSPAPNSITSIKLSTNGNICLLIGRKHVYTINVPNIIYDSHTYSYHLNKMSISQVSCVPLKVEKITNIKLDVIEVHFTPTNLIAVLFSDDCLRIYNNQSSYPIYIYNINPYSESETEQGSLSASKAFGELPVSFDFPEQVVTLVQTLSVYVLLGNGEVYLACLEMSTNGITVDMEQIICEREPLSMSAIPTRPINAIDYNEDAIRIVALKTPIPSLLIVSTPSKIYHCLHITKQSDDDNDTTSDEGRLEHMLSIIDMINLTDPTEDTQLFSTPPDISIDPDTPYRYLIRCDTGVYTVSIPSLEIIGLYCQQESKQSLFDLNLALPETGESSSTEIDMDLKIENSELCGFNLISYPILGEPVLLFIFKDGTCLSKPVPPLKRVSAISLYSQREQALPSLRMENNAGSDFMGKIEATLKLVKSMPITKLKPKENTTQEELYSVFIKSTDILRQQVKTSQHEALNKILQKAQQLLEKKHELYSQINENTDQLTNLSTVNAQNITEKIELVLIKCESNKSRIHNALHQILKFNPQLSEEEKKYKNILNELNQSLNNLTERINLLKKRFGSISYQQQDAEIKSPVTPSYSTPLTSLSMRQIETLRRVADHDSKIKNMKTKIDQMNIESSLFN